MADKSNVNHTHQYEPLNVPSDWSEAGKKFVVRLSEIFDDIYRRFGRLRLEDLAPGVRKTIKDTEGNVLEIQETAEGLALTVSGVEGKLTEIKVTTDGIQAAVDGGRLVFAGNGLTILNSNGDVVFQQEMATGDLTLTGIIRALGGVIGGFTIGADSLHNGSSIILSANGFVQLGDLSITDDPDFGPTVRATGGLIFRIGNMDYFILGEGSVRARLPLSAESGLYINPNDTTSSAANAYIDPATGRVYRSTSSGGGPGPGTGLSATLSVGRTQATVGETLPLITTATGGTGSYSYSYAVSVNGGGYAGITGSGASTNYGVASAVYVKSATYEIKCQLPTPWE